MIIELEKNGKQQTEDWFSDRIGKFTSSQISRLMTEPKLKADKEAGNLSDGAMTYVLECLAEHLTGQRAKEDFNSKYTDWGNEKEPEAKSIYAKIFDCEVKDVGVVNHSFIDNFSGSPDGLVDDIGLLEVKCPFTITEHIKHHLLNIENFRANKPEYFWQCMGYLSLTGAEWIDFVSYSPIYNPKLRIKRLRLNACDFKAEIEAMENKIKKANQELNKLINQFK